MLALSLARVCTYLPGGERELCSAASLLATPCMYAAEPLEYNLCRKVGCLKTCRKNHSPAKIVSQNNVLAVSGEVSSIPSDGGSSPKKMVLVMIVAMLPLGRLPKGQQPQDQTRQGRLPQDQRQRDQMRQGLVRKSQTRGSRQRRSPGAPLRSSLLR